MGVGVLYCGGGVDVWGRLVGEEEVTEAGGGVCGGGEGWAPGEEGVVGAVGAEEVEAVAGVWGGWFGGEGGDGDAYFGGPEVGGGVDADGGGKATVPVEVFVGQVDGDVEAFVGGGDFELGIAVDVVMVCAEEDFDDVAVPEAEAFGGGGGLENGELGVGGLEGEVEAGG